jgi:hypothetical protein
VTLQQAEAMHHLLQNPAAIIQNGFLKCRKPEYTTGKHALRFQHGLEKWKKSPNFALFFSVIFNSN